MSASAAKPMLSYHQQMAEYYPIYGTNEATEANLHYQTLKVVANYLYNNTKKPRPNDPYHDDDWLKRKWFYRPTLYRKQTLVYTTSDGYYALRLVRTHGGGGRRKTLEIGRIYITDTHLHVIIKRARDITNINQADLELANPNSIHELIRTMDRLIEQSLRSGY